MTTNSSNQVLETKFLVQSDGRIAYDIAGQGPLIVLIPGMGDLRGSYRFLAPALRDAGYRVANTDLRGHGDSDTTFPSYGDEETASDILSLVDDLGEPAIIIGNSMGAGAGIVAAAKRPHAIRALVLIGPFVRNPPTNAMKSLILRIAMAKPFAAATWKAYMPKLYAGVKPEDFAQYRSTVVASLRRPGYAKSFSLTTRTNHDYAESQLGRVTAPVLVVMGDKDPDFPNPDDEATWVANSLNGEVAMVADTGHYPQSQRPDFVSSLVIEFLKRVEANE
jgi:pimeloyl-ACP methyl ester carboxylesterase